MQIRRNRCPVKTAQGHRCKNSVKSGQAGCVFHSKLVDDVMYEKTIKYEDGSIQEKYMVKNFLRDGKCERWYEGGDGEKMVECNYKEGKLHGEYKSWRRNGMPLVSCTYKDEKLDGVYEEIDRYDNTIYEAVFENGKIISGKLVEYRYWKGEYDGKIVYTYHPNGDKTVAFC